MLFWQNFTKLYNYYFEIYDLINEQTWNIYTFTSQDFLNEQKYYLNWWRKNNFKEMVIGQIT